jgi:hypothetical protein
MKTVQIPSFDSSYVPGMCNINRAETNQRKKAGYLGLGIFVVGLILLIAIVESRWTRIVLVAPAFLAAIGFLQARNKFCVGYGSAGLQNADDDSIKAKNVADASSIAADKKKSRAMNLQAFYIALALTIVTMLIPVIKH